MLVHERAAWTAGHTAIAGVDEAGRGPLAGSVFAAAVVIPREIAEKEIGSRFCGLTDSKKLSPAKRSFFFRLLSEHPSVHIGIGRASADEIDSLDILRATHLAMRRAVEALAPAPDFLLIDGLPVPDLPVPSRAIVGGDAASLLIAAASVVAKVSRDREMEQLDRLYPGYGFAAHKGYGTREHLDALRRLGPCPIHRRSFAPVRACLERDGHR